MMISQCRRDSQICPMLKTYDYNSVGEPTTFMTPQKPVIQQLAKLSFIEEMAV